MLNEEDVLELLRQLYRVFGLLGNKDPDSRRMRLIKFHVQKSVEILDEVLANLQEEKNIDAGLYAYIPGFPE